MAVDGLFANTDQKHVKKKTDEEASRKLTKIDIFSGQILKHVYLLHGEQGVLPPEDPDTQSEHLHPKGV
jgi:hypothetical protein